MGVNFPKLAPVTSILLGWDLMGVENAGKFVIADAPYTSFGHAPGASTRGGSFIIYNLW